MITCSRGIARERGRGEGERGRESEERARRGREGGSNYTNAYLKFFQTRKKNCCIGITQNNNNNNGRNGSF